MVLQRRERVSELSKTSNINHCSATLAGKVMSVVIGAIVMHSPGLWVKFQYEESFEICTSLLTACFEGIFLLWLYEWLLYHHCSLSELADLSKSKLVSNGYRAAAAIPGLMISSFIVSAIISDATFRKVTGNISPSSGQVAAGYENGRGHFVSQLKSDFEGTVLSVAFGIGSFIGGTCLYLRCVSSRVVGQKKSMRKNRPKLWPICIVCLLSAISSMKGLYCPVIFAYFSVLLDGLSSVDVGLLTLDGVQRKAHSKGPNVIFIQYESLDGAAVLKDEKGKLAMPFFHSMMEQDPDMYVLQHARSVSGNTLDAMPALLTGCLPLTAEATEFAKQPGNGIAYDFFKNGYQTASFCSRTLDKSITSGMWKSLYDLFVGGMNVTFDPISHSMPRDNSEGTDDLRHLPYFADWVQNVTNSTESDGSPFYAQFYSFNTHYPYMKDKNYEEPDRYYSSLRTVDNFLKEIFDILSITGQLDNTIIIGSSDHGEERIGNSYPRLNCLTRRILHAISYIYYPSKLMPDKSSADRLRRNTHQLVSTLDLHATIHGILKANDSNANLTEHHPGCFHGVDLVAVNISDTRVVPASNLISRKTSQLSALMTKQSAIYNRHASYEFKDLSQGKNNTYVMSFDECERGECLADLDENTKRHFREALQHLNDFSGLSDEAKGSDFVDYFRKVLN